MHLLEHGFVRPGGRDVVQPVDLLDQRQAFTCQQAEAGPHGRNLAQQPITPLGVHALGLSDCGAQFGRFPRQFKHWLRSRRDGRGTPCGWPEVGVYVAGNVLVEGQG